MKLMLLIMALLVAGLHELQEDSMFVEPKFVDADRPPRAFSARLTEVELKELFESAAKVIPGVPVDLGMAIALVESGFRPWAVNVAGKSFLFDSKEKALAKASEARAAGRSYDVGLMQVNGWWLDRFDLSLEAVLDPLANIFLGTWILKQEMERHGDLKAAIGAYHSPTPTRADRYADMVLAALKRGPQIPAPKKSSRPSARASGGKSSQDPANPMEFPPMAVFSQKSILAAGGMNVVGAGQESMKITIKKGP